MWEKLTNWFGTGGNDLLSGEYIGETNSNYTTTTTTTGTTFYSVGTTITVPSTPQSTWTVQFPYIVSGTVNNINTTNLNITIKPENKIILSSEKAYFLSEDEIIGLLNPCKAMVEVYQSHSQMVFNGDDGITTYITLEEFLEQFRPELFQKYKLLMEKT